MPVKRREALTGLAALGAANIFAPTTARSNEDNSQIAGTYIGALDLGPRELRLQLDITPDTKAVMTSID